jgi:hypothetical protein
MYHNHVCYSWRNLFQFFKSLFMTLYFIIYLNFTFQKQEFLL